MRRGRRHRQDAATAASLLLIHDALVQIRAMAYRRKVLGTGVDDDDAAGDYHERIRLIADVCENLPGYLMLDARATPVEGLQYAWDKANETQRRWLRATLTQYHHIEISDIITGVADTLALPPDGQARRAGSGGSEAQGRLPRHGYTDRDDCAT